VPAVGPTSVASGSSRPRIAYETETVAVAGTESVAETVAVTATESEPGTVA
jgi:hypothetical protein